MRQAHNDTWRRTLRDRKTPSNELGIRTGTTRASIVRPNNIETLLACLDPANKRPTPIRPMGAASSSTACIAAAGGTVIDMTSLNEVVRQDDDTITVQAGMLLRDLANLLSEQGLEVAGCLDTLNRTVGGAISGIGTNPAVGTDGALLASQVVELTAISATGKVMRVGEKRPDLLSAFRLSYGLLGIIFEITLKTRPARPLSRRYKKVALKEFASAVSQLGNRPVGVRFYLMPFRNHAYVEVRRFDQSTERNNELRWKIRDWGETTVLPAVCEKLSRIVPLAGLRYSLVDGIAEASHKLVSDRQVRCGGEVDEQVNQSSARLERPPLKYSTWCFPMTDAAIVIPAYRAFCRDYYKANKFRCDMPAIGFKLPLDRSALLSPSFDEPMFALRAISNPDAAWEDYSLDYAMFATQWGGVPLFNQSAHTDMAYAQSAYGSRLEFFRKIRRQLDPDNRLLNPFLAQYFC